MSSSSDRPALDLSRYATQGRGADAGPATARAAAVAGADPMTGPRLTTRAAFRAWLATVPARRRFRTRLTADCPLAVYLTQQGAADVRVFATSYAIGHAWRPLPRWARAFVRAFDGYQPQAITTKDARAALAALEESSR